MNSPPPTFKYCQCRRPWTIIPGRWLSKSVSRRTRDEGATKSVRFRAACALARFNPDSPHWPSVARDLVGQLITENRLAFTLWIQSLTPVREFLTPHLLRQFRQAKDLQHREVAAAVLAELYSDDHRRLVELAIEAEPRQLAELLPKLGASARQATPYLYPVARTNPPHIEPWFERQADAESAPTSDVERLALRKHEALRLANVEISLAALGMPEPLWSRLAHNQYPTTRSWIIHRAGQAGIDPHVFKSRIAPLALNQEAGRELSGHLLALGQFSPGQLYLSERQALVAHLLQLYREHPHPGVHSAARWLLHVWGFDDERKKIVLAPESNPTMSSSTQPWWFTTPSQITMVAHGPVEDFSMGTDEPAAGRRDLQSRHRRSIPRGFALATRAVTVAEFQRFEVHRLRTLAERLESARRDGDQTAVDELESRIETLEHRRLNRRGVAEREHPIVDVNWYESAAFCHWLGKQEEIPVEQQYYPDPDELLDAYMQSQPIHISHEALSSRTGYRLPTSAEWEFSSRGLSGL
jgi:eukaryotic-like serine/threonine-protein kinase